MKQYILIAAIASVAIAAIGGGYFCYLNHTNAAYVIRIDITDSQKLAIDTSEVPEHIASESSEWSGTDVQFSIFSNFRENKISTLVIPAVFPLLSNPYQRTKQLNAAYQKVLDTLNSIVTTNTGRPQSVIYEPMANDLNRLATLHNTAIREAIFYTDCQENTNSFSMYNDADVNMVINDPARAIAYFEKDVPLSSLKGITVYFVYPNPPTTFAESRFILMANLWASMFRAKGATVFIGPNLITN